MTGSAEPGPVGAGVAPPDDGGAPDAGVDASSAALLGHRFARPELLREALTHRSAARTGRGRRRGIGSNERLEFIGDRVLGLLVAEWLIERFEREQEGELGRRLASLVSQPTLAAIAETIGLPAILDVAPGEARAGVRQRATVLADAVEALIGALYLDGGIAVAREFVRRTFDAAMIAQTAPPKDAKTALQEWAQARARTLPVYRIAAQEGPAHAPRFRVSVAVGEQAAEGEAGSRQAAEQLAAAALLRIVS